MSVPHVAAFEAELARIEERSPEKTHIIGQYQAVAGKVVELWSTIDERTRHSDWRDDGVGSCRVSPSLFETFVGGPAGPYIENLWDALAEDNPEEEIVDHDRCIYHRVDEGCILGDLKSPRCLGHVSLTHSLELRRLGITLPDVVTPLITIQGGGLKRTEDGSHKLHPEENDELVLQTIAEIEELTAQISVLPVIHPPTNV